MTYRYDVLPGSSFWQSFITHRVRERTLRDAWFYPYINKESVIIDVGAAYGSWSIPGAILGGHVYSFEPRPAIYDNLVHNFEINGLKNYTAIEMAVSDHDSTATMCNAHNSSTIKEGQEHVLCSSTFEVPVTTIDTIVENQKIPRVDYIKVDAEGVELEVLKGAARTIERFHPYILVENHLGHGTSEQEVKDFVRSVHDLYSTITQSFGIFTSKRTHTFFIPVS